MRASSWGAFGLIATFGFVIASQSAERPNWRLFLLSHDPSITDLTRGVYRRLYSGFIKGQRINKLSLGAEAWFWRVLAAVDDLGNAEADPELCRSATAGRRSVTTKQVSGWLTEMKKAGLIALYKAKGEWYLHVIGFEECQPAGKNGKRIQRVPYPDESGCIRVNPDVSSASQASDNDNEYENDNDNEKVVHAARPRSRSKGCDEDYLKELQSDKAYERLNVSLIHAKMVRWCGEKAKQPTRARLLNWLNREDQPMESNGNGFHPMSKADQSIAAGERLIAKHERESRIRSAGANDNGNGGSIPGSGD